MVVSVFQVARCRIVLRVGDLVVAICLLVITSPLILVSALLIKGTDRGPVFILS